MEEKLWVECALFVEQKWYDLSKCDLSYTTIDVYDIIDAWKRYVVANALLRIGFLSLYFLLPSLFIIQVLL